MRILIVEDEDRLARNIASVLREAASFAVDIANDGEDGLHMACTNPYDLIILDLMLPKMDGYKVCRLLKFDERYKRIPIIMLSARSQEADIALGRETGAECYMTKPFDSGELLAKIAELLAANAPVQE